MKIPQKSKLTGLNIFSLLFGGIILIVLVLLSYGLGIMGTIVLYFLSIPLLITYVILSMQTIIKLLSKDISFYSIPFIIQVILMVSLITMFVINSDILKSPTLLTIHLKDEFFNKKLIFRENGTVDLHYRDLTVYRRKRGRYTINNNLIVFSEKSFSDYHIADTLLIDKNKKMVFFRKNEDGSFDTSKMYLNNFEIIYSK